MTRSEPHLGYRVMPKCGCSSVAQVMYYLDYGEFFQGNIHHEGPLLKWSNDHGGEIPRLFATKKITRFTFVRNPYKRLFSAFTDKVFGFQRNGKRYRQGAILQKLKRYGANWGPKANFITNFHCFVQFVADTIERQHPMLPDLHWLPCYLHLRHSAAAAPGWQLDFVGHLENFRKDIAQLLQTAGINPARIPASVPRENTRSVPITDFRSLYGPEQLEIMHRIYRNDFELFGYPMDVDDFNPAKGIDVNRVNESIQVPKDLQNAAANTHAIRLNTRGPRKTDKSYRRKPLRKYLGALRQQMWIAESLVRPRIALGSCQYILILSHMRSRSTLLAHLLGSHPEVSGYFESHIRYKHSIDFLRLRFQVARAVNTSRLNRYVLDKVLHEGYVPPDLINRVDARPIFLLRKPEEAIPSIRRIMKNADDHTGVKRAVRHYLKRVRWMQQCAPRLSVQGAFLNSSSLLFQTKGVFSLLEDFLQLAAPLSEDYSLFSGTGQPGLGDPSDRIRSGTIIREHGDAPAVAVPAESYGEVSDAYASCAETLERFCTTVPAEFGEPKPPQPALTADAVQGATE